MLLEYLKHLIDKDYHLIVIYIFMGWIIYEIVKKIINKQTVKLKKKRQKTMQKLIQNIVKYIIIIIVSASILSILGVSLALKDIMQDILAGVAIVLEDQFDVGDFVEINGFSGTIIDLSLKSTKIKSYENTVKIISNRLITEVTNYSKENPKFTVDIPIPYDVENKLADKVIDKIIKRIEKEIETLTDKVELWGLNKFESSQINYRILVSVKMDSQFSAKRQINRIIKEEFDKANISVPFNIIEVKNG